MGDVNRLALINRSEKPLYLMPGEIIVGGKQDRTLAHETIVPPGKEPVTIDVFCVEHGRWSGRAGVETAAIAQALGGAELSAGEAATLNDKAGKGEFVRSAGNLSKPSRLAVQSGKGQGEVWNQVANQNQVAGAMSSSDAFTANYSGANVRERLQPYLQKLEQPIASQERVVGVIVAVNGKPEMADVFNSTPLFRKLWPKLLKSYALDACSAEPAKGAKACTVADAQAFLDAAANAQVVSNEKRQGLLVTKQSSDRVDSFSASPSAGGFGGGVHSAAFAK